MLNVEMGCSVVYVRDAERLPIGELDQLVWDVVTRGALAARLLVDTFLWKNSDWLASNRLQNHFVKLKHVDFCRARLKSVLRGSGEKYRWRKPVPSAKGQPAPKTGESRYFSIQGERPFVLL